MVQQERAGTILDPKCQGPQTQRPRFYRRSGVVFKEDVALRSDQLVR